MNRTRWLLMNGWRGSWDLIGTSDDAARTNATGSFFVAEGSTLNSLLGVLEVIEAQGLFSALDTERGSHYCTTLEAGGKVDEVYLAPNLGKP